MNNEQNNQIINDAYENYYKNAETSNLIDSHYEPATNKWHLYNREEFIDRCKTDSKISDKWGLKIEERKLTFEERWDLSKKYGYRTGDVETPSSDSIYLGLNERQEIESLWNDPVIGTNLPTKLITVTYKDKTIEVYE